MEIRRLVAVVLAASAVLSYAAPKSSETPSTESSLQDRARSAIARSLPLIQRSGETWYESRTCSSCHHAALNLMTVELAREHGVPIDASTRDALLERYARSGDETNERAIEGLSTINPQIGQAYRWVALHISGVRGSQATDAHAHLLGSLQHADGSWPTQSVRPPLEASPFTATAWSLRVLRELAPAGRAVEFDARVRRARDWLAAARPRDNEDRVMRLFGLAWAGAPEVEIAPAAADLLAAQRPDGGWAQIATRGSDAYATGQALVALHHAGGFSTSRPEFRRGIEHLLATQQEDGSWLVTTRRVGEGLTYFETGFPHGEHQFISYAATSWATCALLSALDEARSPVFSGRPATETVPSAASGDLSPLAEVALTSDVAALRARLEAGEAPDARCEHGLTALVVAAGDPAEVRLLLESGADPSLETRHGTTALVAAAGCAGGAESLGLLLAERTPTWPAPAELDAALRRAAVAGDAANVSLLLDAGARIDGADEMGDPALVLAAYQGDAAMVRFLLSRGASIEAGDAGRRALIAAAQDDRVEVARALLEVHVPVDARDADSAGRTPLGWAVEEDHGDTRMVELLLEGGADPDARTDDGSSVLEFAQRGANRAAERLVTARVDRR